MEATMSEPLQALEKDRAEVLRQISHLGDLRPGSIVGVMGRCSKSNCHCAQPGDPGHGPNFRLTRKLKGKTVAETLSSPAALYKAQREVAEFRKFRELCAKLLEVNEAICQRRPVVEEENLSGAEKKRRMLSIMKSLKK
jgi:hypothetical protein